MRVAATGRSKSAAIGLFRGSLASRSRLMDIRREWANHSCGRGAGMARLGAIFVVFCMVLIAASAGAALYLLAGLKGFESLIVAVAVLTGLATYNAVSSRLRDRTDFGTQIADLSRGTADLARQVAELSRRIAELEGQGDRIIDGAAEKARSATATIQPSSRSSAHWSSSLRRLSRCTS
jgi:membrane protein implicated in regulation of membrane protease activity